MKQASRISAARSADGSRSSTPQPALVWGEPQIVSQRGGLSGAVRSDEPDDAAGLDREIDVVERDLFTVVLREIVCFDEGRHGTHSSLDSPPRGGGAGWVSAGVCANNSWAENPSRLMTARMCGHSS